MRKRWIALGISLLAVLLALGFFLYLRATRPEPTYQMDFVANTHREIPAPVYAKPSEAAEILFHYYNNAVIHVESPPFKAISG